MKIIGHYHLKFLDHLADVTQPLREMLKKNYEFKWTAVHDQAFKKIKEMLTEAPTSKFYDPARKIRISADLSSYGLGAMLEQKHEDRWHLITSGIGAEITLLTDHKPLVVLLGNKLLCELSAHLQRFRMRLMRFKYEIKHVSGQELFLADTLSCAPQKHGLDDSDILLNENMQLYVQAVEVATLIGDALLQEVAETQQNDITTSILRPYVREGWPTYKANVKMEVRRFFEHRGDLSELKDILVYGTRAYIPAGPLRKKMLDRLHTGHLGIIRCTDRAKEVIWWLGISVDIKNLVSQCEKCIENRPQIVEPLMPTQMSERPWQIMGTDLFQHKSKNYVIFVDYFFRYFEIAELRDTSAATVKTVAKKIFARYGVPEIVRANNGPQYREEFKQFAKDWHFKVVTSSPYHSRSNGQVEAAVKIAKSLLTKEEDVDRGLLVYRATSLETGFSPAELLMGRRIRSNIPVAEDKLQPIWPYLKEHKRQIDEKRVKGKQVFDKRHRAQKLAELQPGQSVWVTDRKERGKIINRRKEPRSYDVKVAAGVIRRNRAFLVPIQKEEEDTTDYEQFVREPVQPRTASSPTRVQSAAPRRVPGGSSSDSLAVASRAQAHGQAQGPVEAQVPRRSGRVRKLPDRYDPFKYTCQIDMTHSNIQKF
ncbi:PREDICTED: uncharacterized protein K02A2.6-like [Wasmannia auropunctata]|uniref:uncharacterized protein K02A2.6-like n=1 Tax=Wasmannia auropunctata TaxID=64793 RepID=UPI0005F03F6F|nr:PREDICTED: uncharacterized protein K02A2.6-like [Wasmannia auropunctata]